MVHFAYRKQNSTRLKSKNVQAQTNELWLITEQMTFSLLVEEIPRCWFIINFKNC